MNTIWFSLYCVCFFKESEDMNKSTLKYIGKRLIISAITLFVILVVLFLMVRFLPGSPINNEKLSAAQRAVIEAKYGLDKPIFTQFVIYVKDMLTGNLILRQCNIRRKSARTARGVPAVRRQS